MTEAIKAIKFLLAILDSGTECHCSVFRHIPDMVADTARRRLNDYRLLFNWGNTKSGWVCHKTAGIWTFTRPFLKFLACEIRKAETCEKRMLKLAEKIREAMS